MEDMRRTDVNAMDQKVRQLSDKEREAFHELYHLHQRRVYSICLSMTKNAQEAEDLTQEVFILLFRKIESFRGEAAFTSWLHRITVNRVLMHFRKRRLPTYMSDDVSTGTHFRWSDPRSTSVLDRILLSEVMAKLPRGYREALVLHDVEGLGHEEIAALKGRSAGTSKSQLHQARMMSRKLINQSISDVWSNRRSLRSQPSPG